MAIRTFTNIHPKIAANVFIDDSAIVIGNVSIGADSSIWPGAVLRGDVNSITIGDRTNVQDGAVMHVTHKSVEHPAGYPTLVGNDVTIGHRVILHGCTINDRCLIGMGSCILDDVIIESDVILGAGSLIPPGKILCSGHLWLGSPARCIRALTERELAQLIYSANQYVNLKNHYLSSNHSNG